MFFIVFLYTFFLENVQSWKLVEITCIFFKYLFLQISKRRKIGCFATIGLFLCIFLVVSRGTEKQMIFVARECFNVCVCVWF